jgi:phosphocarrier protein
VSPVEVVIRNRLGLHARAAARFVHLANRYRARILVSNDRATVNGKSILGLLTLAASTGTTLRLRAEGDDGEEAVRALIALIDDGFGEGVV